MVCEPGCSKQLKIVAVQAKLQMYESILSQIFASYVTEPYRREELLVKVCHVIVKLKRQKRKVARLRENMNNRYNVCYNFGAYLQE
jgi:hypothetical protein